MHFYATYKKGLPRWFKLKQKLSKISKIIEIPVKIIFGVYDSNCTYFTIALSRYTGYNVTNGAAQRIL